MRRKYRLKRKFVILILIILTIIFLTIALSFFVNNLIWIFTSFSQTNTKSFFELLINFEQILYMCLYIDYFKESTKKIDCRHNQSK